MGFWIQSGEEGREDVWRYRDMWPEAAMLSEAVCLGDSLPHYQRVPVQELALESLWVQREDHNPFGSHKDRSLSVQIALYREEGVQSVCISSSGNAAIAAAAACREAGMHVFACMSPETARGKVEPVLELGADVLFSSRAIGLAKDLVALGIPNLRPSVDDRALLGYEAISYFLAERGPIESVDSMFCYTTSGSTLAGIWQGWQKLKERGWTGRIPGLHAAQAGQITSIAERFGESTGQVGRSVIGDLGVRRTRRMGPVVRAIRASGGFGWAMRDEEILEAQEWMAKRGFMICLESACSVAAALEAGRRGMVHSPLVVLTGHPDRDQKGAVPDHKHLHSVETVDDFRELFPDAGRT